MRRPITFILLSLCTLQLFSASPAAAQADDASWLLAHINALRQSKGIAALVLNPRLSAAATAHSTYLSTHPWGDAHVESDGSTPASRIWAAGYPGKLVGENVVGGGMATVEWGWQWWLNSPIHYQNMTSEFWSDIGIGAVSGPYGRYYTLDFGSTATGLVSTDAPAAPTSKPAERVAANQNNSNTNHAVSAATKAPPPTRRPTRVPTLTPSITRTPTSSFTPRPSFTPTLTSTPQPPTPTAIVLEISPQPSSGPVAVVALQTQPPPSKPDIAPAMIVDAATQPPDNTAGGGDPIRRLIPWALLLQGAVVGGFIVNAVVRRGRR